MSQKLNIPLKRNDRDSSLTFCSRHSLLDQCYDCTLRCEHIWSTRTIYLLSTSLNDVICAFMLIFSPFLKVLSFSCWYPVHVSICLYLYDSQTSFLFKDEFMCDPSSCKLSTTSPIVFPVKGTSPVIAIDLSLVTSPMLLRGDRVRWS